MAANPIAYGEITILDLLDTATYIYYADSAEGATPSASPADKTYIGIYNGPPLSSGQPDPVKDTTQYNTIKDKIVWSKYVGNDGAGVSIIATAVKYAYHKDGQDHSGITKWETSIPAVQQAMYLWTWTKVEYSNGDSTDSYSVSYIGKDGSDGEGVDMSIYSLEFSAPQILRFKPTSNQTTDRWLYSPDELHFTLFKNGQPSDESEIKVLFNFSKENIELDLNYEGILWQNENDKEWILSIPDLIAHNNSISGHLGKNNFNLVFQFFDGNNTLLISKPLSCPIGSTEDEASFAQYANGIYQAINGTKLNFTQEGLSIHDGGLKIYKTNDDGSKTLVFQAKNTSGNLEITGTIYAEGGRIGDIELKNNMIVGLNDSYQISKDGIIANNLTIEQGATIDNYLALGSEGSYLYNPTGLAAKTASTSIQIGGQSITHYPILRSGPLFISDKGLVKLGQITMYSGNGALDSADKKLDQNVGLDAFISAKVGSVEKWKISADGTAVFREIYADNCRIGNSVLETGSIQSAGNLMVFNDSYQISGIEEEGFLIDGSTVLKANDYVMIKKEYYKVSRVESTELGQKIYFNGVISGIEKGDIITKIGGNGDQFFTISGQSSNSPSFVNNMSLTLSQNIINNSELSHVKKLVLGNLTGLPGLNGYGLYADNVFLKGSLTTSTNYQGESKYAGINTSSTTTATIFDNKKIGEKYLQDNSPIVFWAGADYDSKSQSPNIKQACFQVTQDGSIYARNGLFEGGIISKTAIQGADIYAANIYGWSIKDDGSSGQEAPLNIYNAAVGISFKNKLKHENGDETITSVFDIGSTGLKTSETQFIEINSNTVKFRGKEFVAEPSDSNSLYLHINNQGLSARSNGESGVMENGSFGFSRVDDDSVQLSFQVESREMATFSTDAAVFNSNSTIFGRNVVYGGTGSKLKYNQVSGGYDLYIEEVKSNGS